MPPFEGAVFFLGVGGRQKSLETEGAIVVPGAKHGGYGDLYHPDFITPAQFPAGIAVIRQASVVPVHVDGSHGCAF
jgi:hypothetical protein